MSNWKKGMKAVCVETFYGWPVHKGGVYTVRSTHACCRCWVGLEEVESNGFDKDRCMKCGTLAPILECFFPHEYFRPLLGDEQHELDAIEEEVKETELIPA